MLEQEPEFIEPKIENKNPAEFLKCLSRIGAVITPDRIVSDSYIVSFENGSTVTMKVNFEGDNREDLVITNITESGKNFDKVLQKIQDEAKGKFSRIVVK